MEIKSLDALRQVDERALAFAPLEMGVNGLEEILSGGRVISWLAVTGYPGGWPADLPGVFRAW